jgi:ribosome-binding protein aMBF1 (putative translation factor)
MQQKIMNAKTRSGAVDRVSWSSVREEIADRYLHDPAYRAGYERARRRHELASRVRALRNERGLSQQELAKQVGTSQAAIARLELGGAEPRLGTLERIADALGVDLLVDLVPRSALAAAEPVPNAAHA